MGSTITPDPAEHLFVALSGGVDSAVALMLLKRAGWRVSALFMKNWEEDDSDGHCAAAEDLEDARQVCNALDVSLHTVNFSYEYWNAVFTRFIREYRTGRTPNPDVLCNREVKFHVFVQHAQDLGASRIATGHYARVARRHGRFHLMKGRDPDKDQSYFLHTLGQAQLASALFPLGEMRKRDVRQLACEAGLDPHDKKDSTGICFIGERPFKTFLQRYVEPAPGPILTLHGERVGTHDGLPYYTVGQRHGLGIGGRAEGNARAWYVVSKDLRGNTLTVAQGRDHPALHGGALEASEANWVAGAPGATFACHAKIRHRQLDQSCEVQILDAGRVRVRFASPQWAIAPGQSVVFYRDDECLGGAIIERALH